METLPQWHVRGGLVEAGEQMGLDMIETSQVFEAEEHTAIEQAIFQGGDGAEERAWGEVRVNHAIGPGEHRAIADHRVGTDLTAGPDEYLVTNEIGRDKLGLRMNFAGKTNAQQRMIRPGGHALKPSLFHGACPGDEFPTVSGRRWRC